MTEIEQKADNDARKFAMTMSEKVEKQLREENAKLKEELKQWKDGIALKDEEIGCIETDFNTFKSKAKEIIKDLLNLPFASNEEVFADVGSHLYKAEQFLSEVEK